MTIQEILLSTNETNVASGEQIPVTVTYDVANGDNTLTGVSFSIHFDSTKLKLDNINSDFSTGLFGSVNATADDSNQDSDSSTDQQINWQYVDFSGSWPNVELPLVLGTLNFTTLDNFSDSQLNVTFSDTAPGFTGEAESLSLTLDDNITLPSLSINDVSLAEGNDGNTAFEFTVTLSEASQQDVTVNFSTVDGTATAGEDYTAVTDETVTIAAGETSANFTVNVTGDTREEPNETFTVNLSNPSGATIADGEATATIENDDVTPPPTISINDVTLAEGDEGNTFNFTVTRTGSTTEAITVNYETANGTATVEDGDYTPISDGEVTIAAGETEATISVQVLNDDDFEVQEDFFVNLTSDATNATISDGQGRGIITNEAVDTLLPGTTNGSLSDSDDNRDDTYTYQNQDYYYDFYALPVDSDINPNDEISITLTSDAFDPLLMILNSDGTEVLASTDGTTSTIDSFVVPQEPFFLSVETLEPNSLGDYQLEIVEVI